MPRDPERTYTDLLFASSRKYASWDPEVIRRVGDYGTITRGTPASWLKFLSRNRRQGIFLKEGNIYEDGRAERFGVPPPVTYEHEGSTGVNWIVSQNAAEVDIGGDANGDTSLLVNCSVRASYKFSTGSGAVLCIDGDTISTIDPPGALRKLLQDETLPKGTVIISEVHCTSSYARYLGTPKERHVSIGLRVAPPLLPEGTGVDVSARWMHSSSAGNFKAKVNSDGKRTYYPLFRLVAFEGDDISNGLNSLPDAAFPRQDSWCHGIFRHKPRQIARLTENDEAVG